jgi:cbb3-type cytochrome oxidase subunit 3
MTVLNEWESFYVIVGSGAAALIGLQFVVMTLVAVRPPTGAAEAGAAFGTPTIVHFSTVLLLSALLCAPWHGKAVIVALLTMVGLGGLAYTLVVARRMRRQSAYRPELEDWLFHALLPLVAYAVLALSAVAAGTHTHEALFGIAFAVLLLLFVGIHNAWDAVAYHVFVNLRNE